MLAVCNNVPTLNKYGQPISDSYFQLYNIATQYNLVLTIHSLYTDCDTVSCYSHYNTDTLTIMDIPNY